MQNDNFKQLDEIFSEIQYDLPPKLRKRIESIPLGREIQTAGYLIMVVISLIPGLVWLTFQNYSKISYGLYQLLEWIGTSIQINVTTSVFLVALNTGLLIATLFVLLNYYLERRQQLYLYQYLSN